MSDYGFEAEKLAKRFGFDVVRQPAQVRRRIALSGQHTSVDEELTGLANLVMIGQLLDLPDATPHSGQASCWPGSAWRTRREGR